MSEGFKEPVLKTGDGATHRGFESHSLRQKAVPEFRNRIFYEENLRKKLLSQVFSYSSLPRTPISASITG